MKILALFVAVCGAFSVARELMALVDWLEGVER